MPGEMGIDDLADAAAKLGEADHRVAETAGLRGGYLCLTPFIVFDRFDPEVREVVETVVATRPDAGGWMRRGHGLVAYAYRLKDDQRGDSPRRAAEGHGEEGMVR